MILVELLYLSHQVVLLRLGALTLLRSASVVSKALGDVDLADLELETALISLPRLDTELAVEVGIPLLITAK